MDRVQAAKNCIDQIRTPGGISGVIRDGISDLEQQLAALTTENERLRGQVVKWRDGGLLGAELPKEEEGPYLMGSERSFGYVFDLKNLALGWRLTEFYIPFHEIPRPLPDSEVQGGK